jgi:acyl-CoA synthetase (AMP-forming)/AMP-acid ligase II
MFKSGGYNVYPREVELALESHPEVVLSAVIGVPDPLYNEVGWAYVLRRPGSTLGIDELKQWCSSRIANYKIPKRFVLASELPVLPIGKVDKMQLKSAARAEVASLNAERMDLRGSLLSTTKSC